MIRQKNKGEAGARNAGLEKVRHEWLLFLDSDDWISPDHLERMTSELGSNPGIDAVHCRSARVYLDGTVVVENYVPPNGDLFPALARRAVFPVHACIVRKSLVVSVGKFDTTFARSADWDLWQRIARTGASFGAVPEVMAYYRMRPNASSHAALKMLEDGIRVLRNGHSPDPRVAHPHPDHAKGMPAEQFRTQVFYLLCWCAGLLLGRGEDARPLLEKVAGESFPELYPEAVAQCIYDSATLPSGQPPQAWEQLWPTIHDQTIKFLSALELAAMAPDLARRAGAALKKMILKQSKTLQPLVEGLEEIEGLLGEHADVLDQQWAGLAELQQAQERQKNEFYEAQRLADERAHTIDQQRIVLAELEQARTLLTEQLAQAEKLAKESAHAIDEQNTRLEKLEQARAELGELRTQAQQLADERTQIIEQQRGGLYELKRAHARLTEQLSQAQQLYEDSIAEAEKYKAEMEAYRSKAEHYIAETDRHQEEAAMHREKAEFYIAETEKYKLEADTHRSKAEQYRESIKELEQVKTELDAERNKWRQVSEEQLILITRLRNKKWVRLGSRLGLIKLRSVDEHLRNR